jgi:hypothetical protein
LRATRKPRSQVPASSSKGVSIDLDTVCAVHVEYQVARDQLHAPHVQHVFANSLDPSAIVSVQGETQHGRLTVEMTAARAIA